MTDDRAGLEAETVQDALKDATQRFLLQDRERCPECSSDNMDVRVVGSDPGEVAWAFCKDCEFRLHTDAAAVCREVPHWLL